ncbi:MAG: hypothetical protein R3275_07870 [Saprospiraceae bacterium]|nr:hypothetical protein [Saprospiraceae bacterium]
MRNTLLILLALLIIEISGRAQVGIGITTGIDLYQFYDKGDPDELVRSSTSGSAITNIILGPKIWIGGPRLSVSLEAPVNWGMFHFDVNEFKGMGALAFPLGAKLNFGATSGFSNVDLVGFSLGGGIQYMNTEIYGTKRSFKDEIETGYFSTYYGEMAFGMGLAGFDLSLYFRYGRGEAEEMNLNIGLITNINISHMKRKSKRFFDEMEDFTTPNEVTHHAR